MTTRIKICGITTVEGMHCVAEAGADAIGLVFARRSPRRVELNQARAIMEGMPVSLSAVGLFMDNPEEEVRQVIEEVPLHLLQFHGRETRAACNCWGLPYVKALPMGGKRSAEELAAEWPDAHAFLLDAHRPGEPGGTGNTFEWNRVPARLPRPIVLAGGLSPDNVMEAVQQVRPWAVDVSSGVEREPGRKDPGLVKAFVAAVRNADDTAREQG